MRGEPLVRDADQAIPQGDRRQGRPRPFVDASSPSATSRHFKAGESRYLVEPEVKNGKGGLRDLHTLFWIAKYLLSGGQFDELAEGRVHARASWRCSRRARLPVGGPLPPALPRQARRGPAELRSPARFGRAARLQGACRPQAVERFMKHYFLVAKDVGDLTRIFSRISFEAREMKLPTVSAGCSADSAARRPGVIEGAPDFRIEADRLTIVDEPGLDQGPGQHDPPVRLGRLRRISTSIPTH